jgi:hypothetical protein
LEGRKCSDKGKTQFAWFQPGTAEGDLQGLRQDCSIS